MSAENLNIVFIVLVVLVAAYALYERHKRGESVTPDYVVSELKAAQPLAQELTEVALTGVRAAEQLYRTGRIERDARLTKALNYVRRFFPDLEDDTLVTAIESAVLLINNFVDSPSDKENHLT